MARSKKNVDDDVDLFDTEVEVQVEQDEEEEGSERTFSNKNSIDVSMLKPGTLVIAKDYGANDSKYNSTAAVKTGYPATVQEPGVNEDGNTLWISWALEGQRKKKVIPISNVEEIVAQDSRSRRTRRSIISFEKNEKSINKSNNRKKVAIVTPPTSPRDKSNSKKRNNSSSSSIATTTSNRSSKMSKKSKPPVPSERLQPKTMVYSGKPVEIVSYEKDSMLYYLKASFGDNLLVCQGELDGERQQLDKVISRYGVDFHLLLSKLRNQESYSPWQHSKPHYEKMNKDCYVAYYLGGPGFETVDDVKKKLESLGDFSKISLLNGKMCSRLELLVCPPTSKYRDIFCLKADDFVEVPENEHEGCGFAPPEFFRRILNTRPRMTVSERTFAIQIRVFCSKLGWFKGMLMKKEGIAKVELPESMKKVEKALDCDSDGDDNAYLLIMQTFPSTGCKATNDELNGKIPSKSGLKRVKPISAHFKILLEFHGVDEEQIYGYEQSFCDDRGNLCQPRRDDSRLVGVADPTSSLPHDSVFVSGLARKKKNITYDGCGDTVFVTRYPCNEPEDGKILKVVTSKPQGMSDKDWSYLCSIPFGLLVFGPSSTSIPLPVQVAEGDLDGDLYHVLWDQELMRQITYFHDNNNIYGVKGQCGPPPTLYNNSTVRKVIEDNPDMYDVSGIHGCKESDIIAVVDDIIGHRGHEILVRWESLQTGQFTESWELLKSMKDQIPNTVAEYGRKNKLMNVKKWKWIKDYVRLTEIKCIVSHSGDGEKMMFKATYDGGDSEEYTFDQMRNGDSDHQAILYKYACEKNLLKEWRDDYVLSAKKNWFVNAQNYSAELKHLYYRNKLISAIHRVWMTSVRNGDMDAVNALSKAYKLALDYRKHQNDIQLPLQLIKALPKDLRHCVTNW